MAKTVIAFGRADTGKIIDDCTWDFCTQIMDTSSVETSGSSLTELGKGVYILDNPAVIEDSAFSLHLTADISKYVEGILSPADGKYATTDDVDNIIDVVAKESTLNDATFGLNAIHVEVAKDATVAKESTLNDLLDKLVEIYDLLGLDPSKPLTVELYERRAGAIRQTIETDPNTETTVVTRI